MEKFYASVVNNDCIVLSQNNEIEKLYDCLDNDENFVLCWNDKGIDHSELIIANNIFGKVKTGDIKISAEEKRK